MEYGLYKLSWNRMDATVLFDYYHSPLSEIAWLLRYTGGVKKKLISSSLHTSEKSRPDQPTIWSNKTINLQGWWWWRWGCKVMCWCGLQSLVWILWSQNLTGIALELLPANSSTLIWRFPSCLCFSIRSCHNCFWIFLLVANVDVDITLTLWALRIG